MKRSRMFRTVVGLLSTAIAAPGALGAVMTDITAAQPGANGAVNFTMTDTNTGLNVKVNAAGILATDTPAQKAAKINAAANAAIAAAGPPESNLFSSAVAGAVTTITKAGGGGMNVTITGDTTKEGNNITIKDSGGNGNNWFWRFVRYIFASNNSIVPPAGNTYLVNITPGTTGLNASVAANGVLTVGQLQTQITSQFQSEGVTFTTASDPSGATLLESQYFPVGPTFPPTGFGVTTNQGFNDYLGGVGIELVPEPATLPLMLLGVLLLKRRVRTG